MRIEFQISEDDYVSSGKLFLKARRKGSSYRRIVAPALWIVTGLSTAIVVWSSQSWTQGLPIILVFIFVFAFRLCVPWQLRRYYRKLPILHTSRTLIIDDASLQTTTSVSDSKTTWEPYIWYAENDKMFILAQQGNRIYYPISKHELTPVQITELHALFEAHLPSK
jgi:hypothetical protein